MNAISMMLPKTNPNMKATIGLQKPTTPQTGFQGLIASVLTSNTPQKTETLPDGEKLIEMLQQFLMKFNSQSEEDLSLEQLLKKLVDITDKQHLLNGEEQSQLLQMLPFPLSQQLVKVETLTVGQTDSTTATATIPLNETVGIKNEKLIQEFIRFLKKDATSKGVQLTSSDIKSLFKEIESLLNQAKTNAGQDHNVNKNVGKQTTSLTNSNPILQTAVKMTGGNATSSVSIDIPKQETKVTHNLAMSTNTTVMSKTEQFILHVPQEQGSTTSFVQELSKIMSRGRMVTLPNGQTQLSIKLHPEHLGSLDIQILQRNGEVTAKILASTTSAKDLIDSNLHHLRHALSGQNITVDKIDVSHHTPEWMNGRNNRGNDQSAPQQQEQSHQQNHEEQVEDSSFESWLREMELEEV